jgi:hypothetical protein
VGERLYPVGEKSVGKRVMILKRGEYQLGQYLKSRWKTQDKTLSGSFLTLGERNEALLIHLRQEGAIKMTCIELEGGS